MAISFANKIYDVFKKVFNSAKNYKSEYWKNENAKNYNEKLLAKIRPVIDNAICIQMLTYNVKSLITWLRTFRFLDIENRKRNSLILY